MLLSQASQLEKDEENLVLMIWGACVNIYHGNC